MVEPIAGGAMAQVGCCGPPRPGAASSIYSRRGGKGMPATRRAALPSLAQALEARLTREQILALRAGSVLGRVAKAVESLRNPEVEDDPVGGGDQVASPRTRREALVGASCCTSSVGAPEVVSSTEHSWLLAKGSRRFCNYFFLLALAPRGRATAGEESSAQEQDAYYADPQGGFKLRPPREWSQGTKSGAAVLFKDPSYKFNNLGVTVTPVKVGSLREFATVEQAAEKLVSFEKAKESTMQATVNRLAERTSQEGELFYDFDYSLETTRGNKRVLSTVCIRNNKLYIANGQYFCGDACADDSAEILAAIRASLETFSVG